MNREEAKKKAEALVARMKSQSVKVRCTCNKKIGNSGV